MRRQLALLMTVATVAAGLSACGDSGSSDGKTIKVAYQKFGNFIAADELFKKIKPVFEQQNPGVKLKLIPIDADENSYYTKLGLMRRSKATAPDVAYEDTFFVNSDAEAKYLMPLDTRLGSWPDWSQFVGAAKAAGKAGDGHTYGIPMGTDTRGLWYNKKIFAKAGLPADWQPKTWNDVLAAARQIKAKVPGVIPLNVYAGKGVGEAASMQGFEMLLYGTAQQALQRPDQEVDRAEPRHDRLDEPPQDDLLREARARRRSRRSTRTGATTSPRRSCPRASSPSTWTAPGCRRRGSPAAPRPGPTGPRRSAPPRCRPRTARRPARSRCPAAGCCRSARTPRTPTRRGSSSSSR